jgi:hypothetical protein
MRLDEHGAAAVAAAAGTAAPQHLDGLQQQAADGSTEQQQQQQHALPQQSASRLPAVAPPPAELGAQDLLPSAVSEHIRMLQLWQRTLRLRQRGRLWPIGNACYGSDCVARECERALLEAFAGSSDWDVDMVVNHLFGGEGLICILLH